MYLYHCAGGDYLVNKNSCDHDCVCDCGRCAKVTSVLRESDGMNVFKKSNSNNPFGYMVSCQCCMDWLYCQYIPHMIEAVRIQSAIMIFDEMKLTESFAPLISNLPEKVMDDFIKKYSGTYDAVSGKYVGGEYFWAIKKIIKVLKAHLQRERSACISCAEYYQIVDNI